MAINLNLNRLRDALDSLVGAVGDLGFGYGSGDGDGEQGNMSKGVEVCDRGLVFDKGAFTACLFEAGVIPFGFCPQDSVLSSGVN